MTSEQHPGRPAEVFAVFLKLGLTSFGGPVAHLGYFEAEFVERRKWFSGANFADIVALCQFLPGPASSQVGIAIGLSRAGYLGALAAWTAFTLPSAALLVLFAIGFTTLGEGTGQGWLHGLKLSAVAVVALAILGMAKTLTPDRNRATLAVAAMLIALAAPSAAGQIGGIVLGGLVGYFLPGSEAAVDETRLPLAVSRTAGAIALLFFLLLLVAASVLASITDDFGIRLFDTFYRVGSLVFGGGHVVLPLLKAEIVPRLIGNDAFLAGYGAAQAVPGPLFTFAAYVGAVIGGWTIAALCLIAIFLPSFLLVVGVLPFWDALRRTSAAQSMLRGVNAAVVGLLLAAFYDPVWTSAIVTRTDFALAAVAFLALYRWKAPPWLVVIGCAAAGQLTA